MPLKAKHPCSFHGCPNLTHDKYCIAHAHIELKEIKERRKEHDANRGTASERGYTARWARYRKAYLSLHPLCAVCERDGKLVAATVVDHIQPHKGDYSLMWDASNHQGLCVYHHNRKTATEDGGFGHKRISP
jgi:5-methylcytosine-specific restriction protein A